MSFTYQGNEFFAEDCSVADLAAKHGTPLFVYSKAAITANWQQFARHWPAPHKLCYAVKANSNLAVLNLLARLGAGFDIVSGGELARVLAAGGKAQDVVFSGVGKSHDEIAYALDQNIGCFNVESAAELERIQQIASDKGVIAPISLRVNPDVDAQTHPYIATGLKANKFGIAMSEALAVFRRGATLSNLDMRGIDCHIGSQILSPQPFLDASERMFSLIETLRAEGIHITHLDMGGGFGIPYQHEEKLEVSGYLQTLQRKAEAIGDLTLMLEPGRAIVGNAGIMVTKVEYYKPGSEKNFLLVDAGMNDLLRPSLYNAYHAIVPVNRHEGLDEQLVDVVGPVCETGDFFGHARHLAAQEGDLLAVMNAGAYGFTMASNYNTRPRAAEVMVHGDSATLIREREPLASLWQGEHLLGDDA
ncbi:diaminopimelate decarboxylase [Pseudidiomarina terrestris]|uniref:Diaminopimelate decarboxylase n=1 Tax=Pseudidiomarina terrestris TaxID=2820060 RepID=A0AAW7R2G9_9GAMM|nr:MULTISPECIES: diaminopimelate decarboxylase [unclassified Pseudidiomarina]MDN7124714.1 diaminopimelate decarboxylase [Pseudidiomarina sp. 1APP75-32.1]MDN7129812.1 diaminopimelate decarboxylase [Pseudidiomarina sp. 1APR75-15]MDN7136411.1 diaminopimelate decarboxylase [Pseudidiomarina sp. 1ASP75-5]MDN7137931.1 diaminopimelate decarboxylase [Pseudidiomarina sp. 1ASP75-14]